MSDQRLNQNSADPSTDEIPFIYPSHWEADVVLRDGTTAHLRPVIPTDKQALQLMYAGQSERTIYLRFFAPKPELSEKELTRFTTVDHRNRVALILLSGEEMLGIGRFDRTNDPTEAEVAFMISDQHQGRGIGSILLEHLAAAAKELGIQRFTAEVLPQNRAMLNVFADTGYEVSRTFDDGFVLVQFNIDPTDRSRQVMEAREHRAEAKSIAELLAPKRIAVVGSPVNWQSHGIKTLQNIADAGFTGDLVGICEGENNSESFTVYSSLEETEPVDLAIITSPINDLEEQVRQCGKAGARGALIYTLGFAQDGPRGRLRQQRLVRTARSYGMRIIGPESFGVLNNDPTISLDATLNQKDPHCGNLGVFSQSAVMGQMFSNIAVRRDIGVSTLLSAGNRADVSGNDMMQFWEDDEVTAVCALYLESIGNSRKFSRIARRLSHHKPVIVAKHAVTGLQLPPGHAGRTSITPSIALDSLLKQSGVISAESSEQVLDVAQLLVSMPLPAGKRIAVVSNAAALTQMVTDRAKAQGLEVKLSESGGGEILTVEKAHHLEEIFSSILQASDIDVLIAVYMNEQVELNYLIAKALLSASQHNAKPALGVFPGVVVPEDLLQGLYRADRNAPDNQCLPCYTSPIAAVDALAAVTNYVTWRENEEGTYAAPSDVKPQEAAEFIAELMPQVPGEDLLKLTQSDVAELLATYGIHLLPSAVARSADEATSLVPAMGGYPVVLKSTDDTLSKRLDLGGVRLGIETDEQMRTEFHAMRTRLERYGIHEIEIQKQADVGQSAVLEAREDPLLGPVISFGMTGDATTVLDDWAYRVPPLTESDISQLIREPKSSMKLWGDRGIPAVRVDLLENLAARVALMKDNHPEIISLQLSPIMISDQSLTVARAKISLGNAQQRTDSARRSLST